MKGRHKTGAEIEQIVDLRGAGMTYPQIAQATGINRNCISAILNGRRRRGLTGIPLKEGKKFFGREPSRTCNTCGRAIKRGKQCSTHYWQLKHKGRTYGTHKLKTGRQTNE